MIWRKRCLQRCGGLKMPCMLRLRLSTSDTCTGRRRQAVAMAGKRWGGSG